MTPNEDPRRRRTVALLASADGLALMVFVLVGMRSHHEVGAIDLFLRNAVPLEVAWFAVAAVVGAYRRPGSRTLLCSWVVAVPTGLLARSLWVGSPTGVRLPTFVGVGLVFTLPFLLAARALAGLVVRKVLPLEPRT